MFAALYVFIFAQNNAKWIEMKLLCSSTSCFLLCFILFRCFMSVGIFFTRACLHFTGCKHSLYDFIKFNYPAPQCVAEEQTCDALFVYRFLRQRVL